MSDNSEDSTKDHVVATAAELHNTAMTPARSVTLLNAEQTADVSPTNNDLLPAIFTNGLLSNTISANIFHKPVSALVDSGAMISVVGTTYIKALKSRGINPTILPPLYPEVRAVNDAKVAIQGQVNLDVFIGDCNFNQNFHVVPSSAHEVILGCDFLTQHKAVMDFEKLELILPGALPIKLGNNVHSPHVSHLVAEFSTTLPANSQTFLPCLVKGPHTTGNTGLVQGKLNLDNKYSIIAGNSLNTIYNNKTHILLLNPNHKPIAIPKHAKLGTFNNITDSDILENNNHIPTVSNTHVQTNTSNENTTDMLLPNENLSDKMNDKFQNNNFIETNLRNQLVSERVPTSSDQTEFLPNHWSNRIPASIPDVNILSKHDIKFGNNLTDSQEEKLLNIINSNSDLLITSISDLTYSPLVKHDIDTGDSRPIRQRVYRAGPQQIEKINEHVKEFLDSDIIEESFSPWSSNVILVKKPDGKTRFVLDFRALNDVTKKDSYPLPLIEQSLQSMGSAKPAYFSTLDMMHGYYQVLLTDRSKEKTAFSLPAGGGLYQFKRMAQGLSNSPSTFVRLLENVLRGLHWKNCLVYLDDICIFSNSFDQHLIDIQQIFDRLRSANLKLKLSKCHFAKTSVSYLGHVISKDGIQPNPDKVSAVADYPKPTTVKQVRSFLGLGSYYRNFIQGFSDKAAPLFELTKKYAKFQWTDECQTSFDSIKTALISSPTLIYPSFEKPFYLFTDCSDVAAGFCLSQYDDDGKEHPIAYGGKSLSTAERNYSITEKECLAIIVGIKRFQHYLMGQKFYVVTDHSALKWLMHTKEPVNRIARWIMFLQQFNFEILHRSGNKHQNADALSRREYTPVTISSLKMDEEASPFQIINSSVLRIIKLQGKDKDLKSIINYLKNDILPESNTDARKLLLTIENYFLDDNGVLYHILHSHLSPTQQLVEQLVIPESLKTEVLTACHDEPTAAHMGIDRTLAIIRMRYFWNKMYADIKHWVQSCTLCNTKKNPKPTKAELIPIPVEPYPFHRVQVDITGPFPQTKNGNKYICVFTDTFSKWPEASPLKDISAPTIARTIYNDIICRHGCPSILQSDRGTNFLSSVVRELCKILHISKVHSASYSPKCNGAVERHNAYLIKALAMYTSKRQDDWDLFIPAVLFAYRVTPATSSTLHTPHMILRGRRAILPIDVELLTPDQNFNTISDHLKEILPQLEAFHATAYENIKKAQERMSHYYNKTAKPQTLEIGDYVWIFTPRLRTKLSKKLLHHWHGPFYLTKQITPVTFMVRDQNNKLLKVPVNVSRMKRYFARKDRPIGVIDDDETNDIDEDDIPDDSFTLDDDKNDTSNSDKIKIIIDRRRQNLKTQYLCKFTDTSRDDDWVDEIDISNKDTIKKYLDAHPPKRRGRPAKT